MATVSEVAWQGEVMGFCACCGLRRPLGRVNLELSAGQELVRCIECFFDPGSGCEFRPVFMGEAIFIGQNPAVNFGQTGDVLYEHGPTYFFEPHGNYQDRIAVTLAQLYDFIRYSPKPHSRQASFADLD
jgi:hypothetical protein